MFFSAPTTDTITLPAKDNEPIAALTKGVQIHNELIMLRRAAQKALRRCFARAKREGDLPKHSNPDSLVRFITTVYQGMNNTKHQRGTRKELLDLAQTS